MPIAGAFSIERVEVSVMGLNRCVCGYHRPSNSDERADAVRIAPLGESYDTDRCGLFAPCSIGYQVPSLKDHRVQKWGLPQGSYNRQVEKESRSATRTGSRAMGDVCGSIN